MSFSARKRRKAASVFSSNSLPILENLEPRLLLTGTLTEVWGSPIAQSLAFTAVSDNSHQYFDNSTTYGAGIYQVRYAGGGSMNYHVGQDPQGWRINASPETGSYGQYVWRIVNVDAVGPGDAVLDGNEVPGPGRDVQKTDPVTGPQDAVTDSLTNSTPVDFGHNSDTIGMYLHDDPYTDNAIYGQIKFDLYKLQIQGDLDLDSDNNSAAGTPSRSSVEENVEDDLPGKYIASQRHGTLNTLNDHRFVPLDVEITQGNLLPSEMPIKLIFPSNIRIWTKDGTETRSSGDELLSDTEYTPEDLGLTGPTAELYIEGVNTGSGTISLKLLENSSYQLLDSVVYTVIDETVSCTCSSGGLTPEGTLDSQTADGSSTISRSGSNGVQLNFGYDRRLIFAGNAMVVSDRGQRRVYDFVQDVSTFVLTPRNEAKGTLTEDKVGGVVISCTETDPQGYKLVFSPTTGLLLSEIDPNDNTADRTYNEEEGYDHCVTQESHDIGDATITSLVTYDTYDEDLVTDVTASFEVDNTTTTVSHAEYAYYGYGAIGGPEGTLKKVVMKDADGDTIETKYYRYYNGEDGGPAFAIKCVFTGDSYDRMVAASIDPETDQDEDLAPYADEYYTYNSAGQVETRTTKGTGCSTVSCGLGTTTYTYDSAPDTFVDGYNSWKYKVMEQLPGWETGNELNTTVITYSNFAYQPMLVITQKENGPEWYEFYKYNDQGQEELHAQGYSNGQTVVCAVTGYDEEEADLLDFDDVSGRYADLDDSQGLIERTIYNTSGSAMGYVQYTAVQHGETGSLIKQNEYTYTTHTVAGQAYVWLDTSTAYVDESGTDGITTTYICDDWYDGNQVKQQTVTSELVTSAHHGSGDTTSTVTVYDSYGRPTWTKDARSILTYRAYDDATGAVVREIVDVDTADESKEDDYADKPDDFNSSGGLHLITDCEVDAQGRTIKETDWNHRITYTVYKDADHEVRTYASWDETNETCELIQISRQDWDNFLPVTIQSEVHYYAYTESMSIATTPSVTSGRPDGTEVLECIDVSDIKQLGRSYFNEGGQLMQVREYYDLDSLEYTYDADLGDIDTNYRQTEYKYNRRGWLKQVQTPDGTITRIIYDVLGRPTETWVGTNEEGLLKVSESIYGDDTDAAGQVVENRAYTADEEYLATAYGYDWRGGQTDVRGPDNLATRYTFNNQGQPLTVEVYADSDQDFTIDTDQSGHTELRGKSTTEYDDLGRPYIQTTYAVDPETGAIGHSLSSYTWYGPNGEVIKTQDANGLFTKYAYDGAGRVVATYTGFDAGENTSELIHDGDDNYEKASGLDGDHIIEQSKSIYDRGDLIASLSYQRKDGDTNSEGELDADAAYATASLNWYDGQGRIVSTANYGHEAGGSEYVFASSGLSSGQILDDDEDGLPNRWELGAPTASTAYYTVTSYSYSYSPTFGVNHVPRYIVMSALLGADSDDDRTTASFYRMDGRLMTTVSGYYDNGEANEGDPTDCDNIVDYFYDPQGRLDRQRALGRNASNALEWQDTTYQYASSVNGSWVTATIYPDNPDHEDPGTDLVTVTYDLLGRRTSMTDQRGVVHAYTYILGGEAGAGQLAEDAVTIPQGSDVDGLVDKIGYAYDDLGRLQTVTSYHVAGAPATLNEVKLTYNGWGQVIKSEQAHSGAVGSGTPAVQYEYEDGADAGAARYVRLAAVTYPASTEYPEGRQVSYEYPTFENDPDDPGTYLCRVASIVGEADEHYADYTYLGSGTILSVAHPDTLYGLTLSYGDHTDNYSGLDRFGRIVDQKWATDYWVADEYKYGYNILGDRTYRENVVSKAYSLNLDETYQYDDLGRLTHMDRGLLTSTDPEAPQIQSPTYFQDWTLDNQGNWRSVNRNGSTETRRFNEANEIDLLDNSTYKAPTYDPAGNRIDNKGVFSTEKYRYDAWNRLVEVTANDDSMIAQYRYDGLGRQTARIGRVAEFRAMVVTALEGDTFYLWLHDGLDNTGMISYTVQSGDQGDHVVQALVYQAQTLHDAGTAPWSNAIIAPMPDFSIMITVIADEPDLNPGVSTWADPGSVFSSGGGYSSTHVDRTDYYYNESWQTLEERSERVPVANQETPAQRPDIQYVWDLRYIDSPVLRWRDGDTDSETGSHGMEEELYFTTDANANVTGLFKPDCTRAEDYKYDPYGRRTTWAGATASWYHNTRGFAGYMMEESSANLYLVRNRAYDCYLGMWLQRDPARYVWQSNLYEYAGSAPCSLADPDGFAPLDVNDTTEWVTRQFDLMFRSSRWETLETTYWSPEGRSVADLLDTLQDLNSRKDYDFAMHGGKGGPDSAWLWNKIQLIERSLYGDTAAQIAKWLTEHPTATYGTESSPSGSIRGQGTSRNWSQIINKSTDHSFVDKLLDGLAEGLNAPGGAARATGGNSSTETVTRSLYSDELSLKGERESYEQAKARGARNYARGSAAAYGMSVAANTFKGFMESWESVTFCGFVEDKDCGHFIIWKTTGKVNTHLTLEQAKVAARVAWGVDLSSRR